MKRCVTLRYLVTGDIYSTLAASYRLGDTTVLFFKLKFKLYIRGTNFREY